MNLINLITDTDIESPKIVTEIETILENNENFIYITAAKDLKELRIDIKTLGKYFTPFNINNETSNLFTFKEFEKFISTKVYKNKNNISNSDQKYILTKIIENTFESDEINLLLDIKHEIFEFFDFLQFNDVPVLNDSLLNYIRDDYFKLEYDLFSLYNTYVSVIDMIKNNSFDELAKYDISLFNIKEKEIDVFINKFKEEIDLFIDDKDIIILDGFMFLNDYRKYLISSAVKKNKPIYLIFKYKQKNNSSSFMFDEVINFANDLGVKVTIPKIEITEIKIKSALDYLKSNFYEMNINNIDNSTKKLINDGSISVIQPFINREDELKYVVDNISNYLRNCNIVEEERLNEILKNDIAVVFSADTIAVQRLSELLREKGVFFFRGENTLEKIGLPYVDVKTFEKIYYSKSEFLQENIKDVKGMSISNVEKLKLFARGFKRINLFKSPRTLTTYPVIRYIIQIYDILLNGMSIEGFKILLFSNWKNVIDSSELKWDNLISELKYIERYVENKKDINDWIDEIEKLLLFKDEITENVYYKHHPISNISKNNLLSILQIVYDVKEVLNVIEITEGNLKEHAKTLQKYVMKADNISNSNYDDLDFEQIIVRKFYTALEQIGNSSFIDKWDTKYFASNLQSMIKDWERESIEDEQDCFFLNTINFTNSKKYKQVYIIMCEASKYPKRYSFKFPFTKNIMEILVNEKYEILKKPEGIYSLSEHLKVERVLFKNALDFTNEKLIITMCTNENGLKNNPSTYIDYIYKLFDSNIVFSKPEIIEEKTNYTFTEKNTPRLRLGDKKKYRLTEISKYILCPKLYFYINFKKHSGQTAFYSKFQLKFYLEAVLYCDLFNKFKNYNKVYRKIYILHETEYISILEKLFEKTCDENIKYFSFFSDYELKDIKNAVMDKIIGFVCNNIIKSKDAASFFTVLSVAPKIYNGDNYDLIVDYDTSVYMNKKSRISQNSLYVDFLVLKTEKDSTDLIHYADMINALDENQDNCDRINLVTRIIGKINIQFDSVRFANDGIKRTNYWVRKIKKENFLEVKAKPSRYCQYCTINDICMEKYIVSKEGE